MLLIHLQTVSHLSIFRYISRMETDVPSKRLYYDLLTLNTTSHNNRFH